MNGEGAKRLAHDELGKPTAATIAKPRTTQQMETDQLIRAIAADAQDPRLSMRNAWSMAVALAAAMAALAFFAMLGPRQDIAEAAQTYRFLFKFVITFALAAGALKVLVALSRPGTDVVRLARWLFVAPALLAVAVLLELFALPSSQWANSLVGSNSRICLTFIPLIGILPLAIFLIALLHSAPTRPALAGAVAGLSAGGLASSFYAAQCTDDSPLFVLAWYTIAIVGLMLAGALVARRVARW